MSQVEDQKKALKNKITNVAEKVSDEKYYVEGEDYEMMARRVGGFIGAAEDSIDNMKYWGNEFTNLIQAKKLIPAGRILANAGTYFELLNDKQREYLKDYIEKYHPHELRCGQMLNCYVLPVEDSKHGPGSIYESLEDAADITAMEGGVGENFSNLRPAGSPIRGNPKYKSSGPLAFMNIYNASSVGMKQGGGRRGANMAILDCDHPDIFEFIHCKDDENKMTNYNISVGIYDSFMEACEKDTMWSLQFGGKEYDKVPARKLLRELSHHAWEKVSKGGGGGEPGFVFLDNAAKTWPFPKVKPKATNPCAEQFLDPYEACCLAAMNLYAYIYFIDGVAKFDMHQFKLDIYKAIRFLDNVLDLNNYPLKYRNDICRDISMRHRRIGLGIMGLADVLMVLGFGYDTDQALGWVDMVMGEFAKAAHGSSVQLAHEKSPFIDHMEAREEFQNRRNCAVTTIAPTGTTSMIIGVNGGCEPFYGLVMQKNTTDGSGNVYYMVSEQFRYLCDRFGVELTEARLEQIYKNRGSVQGLDWVPEGVKKVARTTMDIDAAAHVKMQCVLQKHIENSISKTVNLPKEATVEDVENSIFALWRGGAKGGTIYRDGSRDLQILNVGSNTATKEPASVDEIDMENRPDVLHGNTHRVKANLLHGPENAYVTINELKGKPVEVFIHAANEQQMDSFLDFLMHNGVRPDVAQLILSKVSQMSKDNIGLTTRMVSLALRYNVPLVAVIKQLRKINFNDLYSLHKKLAHILAGYLEDETPYDICQNLVDGTKCGGTLVFQESCLRCIKCYDSKCS